MIHVKKTETPPATLLAKGSAAQIILQDAYATNPSPYHLPKSVSGRSFPFDQAIYAASDVRIRLANDQHQKCCYCERQLLNPVHGDHWRPKTAVQNGRGGSIKYPGYYWLAYRWENLFASCFTCNSNKGDFFPIKDGVSYTENHFGELESIDDILIVHPCDDDPEDHITFSEEIVKAVHGSLKGRNIIDLCGLDCDETEGLRRRHLSEYRKGVLLIALADRHQLDIQLGLTAALNLYDLDEVRDLIEATRKMVENAMSDEAPFAGMIRANFKPKETSEIMKS